MTINNKIIIDTREQCPLWKEGASAVKSKLDTGDYSFIDEDGIDYRQECVIEFKSPADAVGTFGRDHARFKRELERAKNLEYFAIVIACTYTNLLEKNFPYGYKSKIPGHVLMQIIETIHIKYKIPIFFCDGRNEAKKVIRGLFNAYKKNKMVLSSNK